LKLTAVDTNGIAGSNSVAITVATVPYVNIDTPTANAALNGIVPVSGWALENLVANGAAISTVQAFVDGAKVGNATYGTPRTDVCASLNRAGCPNVGWTYNLDTTALAGGSHVLRMLATDANNVTGFTEIPFTTAGVLPYVSIDTPGANASLSGIVPISGWSLEGVNAVGPSAVSTVDVYVDNLKVGSATYGNPRADVCAVLPGRLGCPNVGWSYNLDTTSLSAASHVLKIVATDSSGNTGSQQVTFTTAATPFVDIDYPGSNATLSGIVPISGWSLEGLASVGPNAVTKVDVYVDGAKVGSAVYGGARPDVCAALPGRLGCPNVAWNYNLDTGSLGAGGHLLKIVATDSAGNTGSNQVTFQIALLPYVAIESPSQNATLSGVVPVGGWALESLNTVGPNAVTKVDVYVDGAKVGSAVYGGARADVCAVLPNRLGCPNVGWSYNLDTTALAPGTHVLKIVATDSANAIGSNQLNFNIASVQPYVNIDLPAPNATVTGLTPVSGWALEGLALPGTSAVTGVDIYVDGAKVGSATYGGVRTDVCAVLPGRPGCPNIGWGYLLDTTALASGSHVLKALATDGNGVTGFSQITINVPSALPYVDIDLPAPNATLTGVVPMSGWALEALNSVGPAAISSMQVFVDGVLNGTATYGSSRADVCAALPGRLGCPNVGWSYSLDTSTLSSGAHVLKVTATDTLGNTGFSQLNFTTGVQPFVAIDLPQAGATLTGAEPISGWALEGLNSIGLAITGVDVYVDGTKVGSATYGSPRSDVCAALPNRLGCPNVGWSYTLDTTLLTGGTHTLKIVATDTSGNTGFTAVSFSTAVGVLPYIDIDAPINNATLSGIAPISGWALEGLDAVGNSAISTVDVYVDGTKVGSAIYGGARADVCAALPNRPGCPNVAWNYALDTTGLAAGSHVLKVVATDGNGITNFNQVQFNK
jgi:N-acetylmuramoyl-L-alanine amidase